METKLVRIAEISATSKHPIFERLCLSEYNNIIDVSAE